MRKLLLMMVSALCLLTGLEAHADSKTVRDALTRTLPGVVPDAVRESAVSGLYEVVIGPQLFYLSEDGRFLIQGKLIDLETREDLTEPKLAQARANAIEKIGKDNMVIFAPQKPQYTVSVFTDIDCGYCRKLHSEVDQYLKAGIQIQYLFYPRAGKGSSSYEKAVAVWCAKDRNKALTRAKKGESIEPKQCANPVDEHMALGNALGATGTPMIVTEQGKVLPGYVPAKQLANLLAYEKTDKQAQLLKDAR